MLPLKYTLKTTAKTTQNIIYENHKIHGLTAACSRFSILLRASAATQLAYAGSTATSAQERYEQRTAFWLYGYARMLFITGRRLRRLVWLALATSSAGKRARACGAGRGLAFSLTATAQTRTRETAEASNEIIPRGGAKARVFAVKPSPFLMFFVGFGEKIGGHGGLLGRLLA